MKKHKISFVMLGLLLAASVILPLASAVTVQKTVQLVDEPKTVVIDQKNLNEIQKNIIDDLKTSTVIDEKERETLINEIKEIWNGKSAFSDSEKNKILNRIVEVLLLTYNPSPAPKWIGCTNTGCPAAHNDMAKVAGQKMGIGSTYSMILYNNAGVPDTWSSSIDHFAISGAPNNVKYWANIARKAIRGGNPTDGYRNLAYAMHFMSDMSVPFHYAPVYLNQHVTYESYVDTNWASGRNYGNAINSNNYYYYISDPSASASNLASYSNQYQSYIVSAMANSGWRTNSTLVSDTRDCLIQGERYDMGLIDYARRA
jgi:hypothetical protein